MNYFLYPYLSCCLNSKQFLAIWSVNRRIPCTGTHLPLKLPLFVMLEHELVKDWGYVLNLHHTAQSPGTPFPNWSMVVLTSCCWVWASWTSLDFMGISCNVQKSPIWYLVFFSVLKVTLLWPRKITASMQPRHATWMTHVRSTVQPISAHAPAVSPQPKCATSASATRHCVNFLTRCLSGTATACCTAHALQETS